MEPVVCMLIAFSLLGTMGNVITLYFFIRKPSSVPHIFIRTLASADLVTCVLTLPINIWMEHSHHNTDSLTLCRTKIFLTTSTIPFASMLIVPIAVDRLLSIFKPYSRGMKKMEAIGIIIAIALCSALFGSIYAMDAHLLLVGPFSQQDNVTSMANLTHALLSNFSQSSNISLCTHGRRFGSREFMENFSLVYSAVFGISGFVTLTLYIIIYAYIVSMRRKFRSLIVIESEDETSAEGDMELENQEKGNKQKGDMMDKSMIKTVVGNIKLGVILFTASIVFIVAYLPAFLMAHKLIPLNLIVFFMYFSYNVLHPLTYVIFDETIRKELFPRTCCRCIFHRSSKQLRAMPTETVVKPLG